MNVIGSINLSTLNRRNIMTKYTKKQQKNNDVVLVVFVKILVINRTVEIYIKSVTILLFEALSLIHNLLTGNSSNSKEKLEWGRGRKGGGRWRLGARKQKREEEGEIYEEKKEEGEAERRRKGGRKEREEIQNRGKSKGRKG